MRRGFRFLMALGVALLPGPLKRFVMNRLLGHEVHPSARIGPSIVLVERLVMEEGASIGPFNMIKGQSLVHLKAHASIGILNWITAVPRVGTRHYLNDTGRRPELVLRRHAAITGRHYVDSSDRIEIGECTIIAGNRTQIYTHAVDMLESRQKTKPIEIGDHVFVGAACVLLPGARIPRCTVVGAMALVNKDLGEPFGVHAGVPARRIRELPPEETLYFKRETGWID